MFGDRVHYALSVLHVTLGFANLQARSGIVVAGLSVLEQTSQDRREFRRERAGVDEVPIERSEHLSMAGERLTAGQSTAETAWKAA
jgi:hypothetical protein